MNPRPSAKNIPIQNNRLAFAICTRDLDALHACLESGADPVASGPGGLRWLSLATLMDFPDAIAPLSLAGAPIHGQPHGDPASKIFTTPLIQAVKTHNLPIVQALLAHGAETDELDSEFFTALDYAMASPRLSSIAAALLAQGASRPTKANEHRASRGALQLTLAELAPVMDLDAPYLPEHREPMGEFDMPAAFAPLTGGFDPEDPHAFAKLVAAAGKGNVEKLEAALAKFPNHLDKKTPDGKGLLLLAANSGSNRCVEMLLEAGIDADETDRNGWTVAIHSAKAGWAECLRLVLAAGADPDWKSYSGDTALHWSSRNRHRNCSKLLLVAGADTSLIDPSLTGRQIEKWVDAIMGGAFELMEDEVETLNFLAPQQKAPARIVFVSTSVKDIADANFDLLTYAWKGSLEWVENAFARGAEPNFRSEKGDCAIHLAAERGKKAVLEILLERGANLRELNQQGLNALHLAAHHARFSTLEFLLSQGIPIDCPMPKNSTSFMDAISREDMPVARKLLDLGADIHHTDNEGHSALSRACYRGRANTALTLFEWGGDPRIAHPLVGDVSLVARSAGHIDLANLIVSRQETLDLEQQTPAGRPSQARPTRL